MAAGRIARWRDTWALTWAALVLLGGGWWWLHRPAGVDVELLAHAAATLVKWAAVIALPITAVVEWFGGRRRRREALVDALRGALAEATGAQVRVKVPRWNGRHPRQLDCRLPKAQFAAATGLDQRIRAALASGTPGLDWGPGQPVTRRPGRSRVIRYESSPAVSTAPVTDQTPGEGPVRPGGDGAAGGVPETASWTPHSALSSLPAIEPAPVPEDPLEAAAEWLGGLPPHHVVTPESLAGELGVDRSAALGMLDRLTGAGLLHHFDGRWRTITGVGAVPRTGGSTAVIADTEDIVDAVIVEDDEEPAAAGTGGPNPSRPGWRLGAAGDLTAGSTVRIDGREYRLVGLVDDAENDVELHLRDETGRSVRVLARRDMVQHRPA